MLNEVFGPLKRAARAIFKDDIKVARGESGVRVFLHDGQGPALPPEEIERRRVAEREQAVIDRMRQDIRELFVRDPDARHRLRQLSQFEQMFHEQGPTALKAAPLPLLRAALTQFESEVVNWGPEGLACLRSKMAVAVRERETAGEEDHGLADPPSSGAPAMSVSEIDVDLDSASSEEAALLAAYGAAQAAPTESAGR